MSWFRFLHRKRFDSELQDEIETFLAEEAAENEARGMSPDEARRHARVKLGNAQKVRESLWTQNSLLPLANFGRELKYALRTLMRTPAFSIIAVVVMALCIGAATSLFTIVRSVLLRPLPFPDPQRLVMVHEHFRGAWANKDGFNYNVVAPADFYDWRAKTHGFEDMAVMRYNSYNLTGERDELPEAVQAAEGSWNFFHVLGVQPALGRDFAESEDHIGSNVVMLTWSVFQRRFAGDPSLVGRPIHLDGKPFTVIGVLPSWFTYPNARIQLWVPYQANATPEFLQHHDWHQSEVIARLRPDVSLASAVAQVGAIQYQIHLQHPHDPVAEDVAPRSLNQNMLTLQYSLPEKKYDTPEKRNAFNENLLARVRSMPGVIAAALGNTVPAAGYWGDDVFTVKEHPPLNAGVELPDALTRWADPGYFKALGIPFISGRTFTEDERVSRSYKVIVSQQLVKQYFPGEDPIGKHLHVPAHFLKGAPDKLDFEIVGVVGDTLYQVGHPTKPAMYFPFFEGIAGGTLAVHTASDPLRFSVPVQKQIAALDPSLPVSDVLTMDQVIGESLVNASLSATLVLAFAILSLVLASVGLYGVLSYLTTQRTTELGIRMALGAQRDSVLQLMLVDGLKPALLGLGVGLAVSVAVTRIFQSMLFGTKPLDPMVLGGVVGTLLLVALLACLAPAWRASRLDPMQALRIE